ncbi:MAG: hypothetical protein ACREBC_34365, partial [Pyrinomonadaceae bacterium]
FSLRRNNCNGKTLPPAFSCRFEVRFTSSAVGERAATVTVPSNAISNPHLVLLSGVGAAEKVLLLLHGMNSNPFTWDEFVAAKFPNSCPVILGSGIRTGDAVPNQNGVLCYRLAFGNLDATSGRTALEGEIGHASSSGDFETFEMLGQEVRNAVQAILDRHRSAGIVLLGHSRGGLAARAFLQEEAFAERSSIIGLLTTGTPHKGSRLGRIYEYLAEHPRSTCSNTPCEDDWEVVDLIIKRSELDVRRPTMDDLTDFSFGEIDQLNRRIVSLPSGIKYGQITYRGIDLGILKRVDFPCVPILDRCPPYSIFARPLAVDVGKQLSRQAEEFILDGKRPGRLPAMALFQSKVSGTLTFRVSRASLQIG